MALVNLQDPIRRLDRVLLCCSPLPILIVLLNVTRYLLHGPQWLWNEARLAPAFSMMYGYHLYPGHDTLAPVVGTLHAPVGYILFAGLSFLKDPTIALLAACGLATVLYFTPLVWLHLRAGGKKDRLISLYALLACAAIVVATPGTSYAAFSVHVDASATAAAVLAAGLLVVPRADSGGRGGTAALTVSAFLGVLAVGCKQIMAPVPVALALFVLLVEGRRTFARYIVMQAVSALAIAGALLAIFRPTQDFLFNTVWLATHRPPFHIANRLAKGMYFERESLAAVIPVLFVLGGKMLWLDSGSLRARLRENRWLVFALLAAFQVPFSLRAWTTVGGDHNHLAVVTLFGTIAATLGLALPWHSGNGVAGDWPALLRRILPVGIIVAVFPLPWGLKASAERLFDNHAEVAFRYEKAHPGRAYFPMNPLASLLAEGRLTHFDPSLVDREITGCDTTPALLAAGLPPHFQLVAWRPDAGGPSSEQMLLLLQSMTPVREPDLEGWRVFAWKDGAAPR